MHLLLFFFLALLLPELFDAFILYKKVYKKFKKYIFEQKNNFSQKINFKKYVCIFLRICDLLDEVVEHVVDAVAGLRRDVRVADVVLSGEGAPVVVGDCAVEDVALVRDKDGGHGGPALPADLSVPQLREVERLLVAAVVHDEPAVGASQEVREGEGPALDVRREESLCDE